jgi:hypothetical protein
MTTNQIVIAAFALVIGGLCLPLGSGARSALFLLLIGLIVLTLLGGGMQFLASIF